MNQNNKIALIFLGLFGLFTVFSVTGFLFGGKNSDNYNVQVIQQIAAGDDLDLKAVGNLVKKAKTAEELEKLINVPTINNLDLNEDNKVDYIKVTEYGEGNNRGFSLTTELEKDQEQEIATIDIEKQEDHANVQVQGNPNIYGNNHYYHSRFGLGDALLLAWLFRPHTPYFSPFGFGRYPSYHQPYSYRPTSQYQKSSQSTYNNSPHGFQKSSSNTIPSRSTSPNKEKIATNIKAPIKNPTATQKSFQARNPSKRVGSGGFGKTSNTNNYRPSVRTNSSQRSGGFFGGK